MVVAEVVGTAMKMSGLNQGELARHLNVSDRTVHRWRKGDGEKVDAYSLAEIFRLAGRSLDREFGLGDPERVDAEDIYRRITDLSKKMDAVIHATAAAKLLAMPEPEPGPKGVTRKRAERVGQDALDDLLHEETEAVTPKRKAG